MIRVIAVLGFALAIVSPTQAMPLSPIQSESMVTPVVAGCGRVGQGLMVFASPESRNATTAEKNAGACDGMEAFALNISEMF